MDQFNKLISNLLDGKSSSVLGVDVSSSSIKVVQLAKDKGKATLETYGELALGPYAGTEIGRSTNLPADKIVEAMNDILREAKITAKEAGVAIPMSSSLIRLIEMPDLGEDKLKKMIPLEIRKYIPVPISEVLLDWWIIPRENNYVSAKEKKDADGEKAGDKSSGGLPEKTVDVLVVAIHNEIFTRYRDIVNRAGLEASFFEIEIFSTLRAVLGRNTKPIMIIDIGAATTKIYIVEKGVIRSSHIVNSGSQDITMMLSTSRGISVAEAEEEKRKIGISEVQSSGSNENPSIVLENIFFEAKRLKTAFEKKTGESLEKTILTGGGSIITGLEPLAQEIIEVPVEVADPFSRIETPAFLKEVLKKVGPEFAVAIGAALRKLDESR